MGVRIKIILYFLALVAVSVGVSWLGYKTQTFHSLAGGGLLLGLIIGFVIAEGSDKIWMFVTFLLTVFGGAFLGYIASLEPNSFAISDYYSFWSVFNLVVATGLGMFLTSSVIKISIDQ